MSSNIRDNAHKLFISVKSAVIESNKVIKTTRDPRSRLLSDSSNEVPKGILKNPYRIPTKRSVSECVDDLSQIMADLDISIHDISQATGKFCAHHQFFNELEEVRDDDDDDDNDGDQEEDDDDNDNELEVGDWRNNSKFSGDQLHHNKQRQCDCNSKYGDASSDKPKKSVRFSEKVYETYYIASRLYDRRCFAKYHSSTRHHPPSERRNKKNNKKNSSKVENKDDSSNSDDTSSRLTKSQRAKQSKKDRKKRMSKRDEVVETSSDDQGYSSSIHSFSD